MGDYSRKMQADIEATLREQKERPWQPKRLREPSPSRLPVLAVTLRPASPPPSAEATLVKAINAQTRELRWMLAQVREIADARA